MADIYLTVRLLIDYVNVGKLMSYLKAVINGLYVMTPIFRKCPTMSWWTSKRLLHSLTPVKLKADSW